jgi:hypothetical protein
VLRPVISLDVAHSTALCHPFAPPLSFALLQHEFPKDLSFQEAIRTATIQIPKPSSSLRFPRRLPTYAIPSRTDIVQSFPTIDISGLKTQFGAGLSDLLLELSRLCSADSDESLGFDPPMDSKQQEAFIRRLNQVTTRVTRDEGLQKLGIHTASCGHSVDALRAGSRLAKGCSISHEACETETASEREYDAVGLSKGMPYDSYADAGLPRGDLCEVHSEECLKRVHSDDSQRENDNPNSFSDHHINHGKMPIGSACLSEPIALGLLADG